MNTANYIIQEIDGEDYFCIRIKDIKRTRSTFKPPTIEEVTEYCKTQKNGVDAYKWWHFYNGKNWKVGNAKMSQWRSAVATWEKDKDPLQGTLPESKGTNLNADQDRKFKPEPISKTAMTHEEYLATKDK
jgi:hypothetical protein